MPHGRGSHIEPPNRFTLLSREIDLDALDEEDRNALAHPATHYILERSGSIVSENNSPDIPFRYSINPYRGCLHGCPYCYARPTHEYFGFNAGLDFETKIVVKENAPELFRDFLNRPCWKPESITMSGVTDCYQPAERQFQLTRGCLEVAVEARQPMGIITKNALVVRDLDLLAELAARRLTHVAVSVTTLDAELARLMEPRTSNPAARLRAIKELSAAGVPVRVMVAPIIPGLNDWEVPAILRAAKEAGARAAGFQLLRLPLTVAPVFLDWLQRERPDALEKIEGRVRSTHDGKLNKSAFHDRFRGTGVLAEQIRALFRLFARRLELDGPLPAYDCSQFRPPRSAKGERWLF
jgi:DNA repair photolyase